MYWLRWIPLINLITIFVCSFGVTVLVRYIAAQFRLAVRAEREKSEEAVRQLVSRVGEIEKRLQS